MARLRTGSVIVMARVLRRVSDRWRIYLSVRSPPLTAGGLGG
jgi:hypothetical protein